MSKIYKLGVVGDPIEHSLSPFIHSRFARNENINIEYLPYKITDANFDNFIKEFFSDSSSKGLNVTLPHKKRAANINGEISKEAKFINAVNTIAHNKNQINLYSTDGVGFTYDLNGDKNFNFQNKNILFIGAGAAIESILYRVAKEQVSHITVINRTKDKADRLMRKFSNMASINTEAYSDKSYDLIINGSSAGITGDFQPIADIKVSTGAYFYDLNYSLVETPFCKWALGHSNNVYDGMGMLVYQAAHSFDKWFGVFPETERVINDLESMRE